MINHLQYWLDMSEDRQLLERDHYLMMLAIIQAKIAEFCSEVPVGAVLIKQGCFWCGCNRSVSCCDPTAHAEIVVLRTAAASLNNYRMPGAELYVTVEPCMMCLGAILHARVSRLVFGCFSTRDGAVVSNPSKMFHNNWFVRLHWQHGILGDQCLSLIHI